MLIDNCPSTASISEETRPKTLSILNEFSTQLPRAAAPRRLALDVATGNQNVLLLQTDRLFHRRRRIQGSR